MFYNYTDPNSFGKKVEAEVTLKSDGSFKHIEIKFIVRHNI